jgi:hypothetical protein
MGQKSLIALFCLILSSQVFSRPPHERASLEQDIYNAHQHSIINTTMLNGLDVQIEQTRDFFESEKANLGEPGTKTEGMIRAALIDMINLGLGNVDAARAELDDSSYVTDQDVESIEAQLRGLNIHIEELKI